MQNRTCLILVIVLVVAGLLLLCVGAAVAGVFAFVVPGRVGVSETTMTELAADTPATLQVRNQVGEINVVTGPEGIIQIEAEKEARARSRSRSEELRNAIRVRVDRQNGTARVVVDLPQTGPNENVKVDLRIRVPHRTSLDITNNVGEVNIEGVMGDIRVGNDVGSVVLNNVDVTEEAAVETATGDVEFTGRLPESQGRVLLRSGVGGIQVRVPAGSRFALDAETNLGGVEASFVVDEAQAGGGSGGQLGHWLRGSVNGGVGVDLVLRSGTGSITLQPIE
jgi:hypothetical protein